MSNLNTNNVEYCRAILTIRSTMTISLKLLIMILNDVIFFLLVFFSLKKALIFKAVDHIKFITGVRVI